jgi:hypothetical protein
MIRKSKNSIMDWDLAGSLNISDKPILRALDFRSSYLSQLLGAHFLDLRLPDLVGHPGRGTLRLFHLYPLALKYMDLLSASLS